jgi:hypothetical protein
MGWDAIPAPVLIVSPGVVSAMRATRVAGWAGCEAAGSGDHRPVTVANGLELVRRRSGPPMPSRHFGTS